MKRWLFWSFVSVTTFLVGLTLVFGTGAIFDFISYANRFDSQSISPVKTAAYDEPTIPLDIPPSFDPNTNYAKTSKIKLLQTGFFHADEVPYRSGERWIGLFREGDQYRLKPTKLIVKTVIEPDLYDTEVATSSPGPTLFLLKGKTDLQFGDVLTVFDGEDHPEYQIDQCNNLRSSFRIKGMFWKLCMENSIGGLPQRVTSLVLLAPGSDPVVLRTLPDGCNDCTWKLLWAGDLDRDTNVDFLIDVSNHYNSSEPTLFLSSAAYSVAASFWKVGC